MKEKIKNKQKITNVYIDGANLHRGVMSQNWTIDYCRFFKWLSDKYHTKRIFIFLGYIKTQETLYAYLRSCGFSLVFKETLVLKNGTTKGNCDAELIVQALEDFYERTLHKGVLVSGDGDFVCLIDFWQRKKVEPVIIAPSRKFCSYLLKRKNVSLTFFEDKGLRHKIEKTPSRD